MKSPYTVFKGAYLDKEEVHVLQDVESKINEEFKLIPEFQYIHKRKWYHSEVLKGWSRSSALFYAKNGKVEGVAIADYHNCEDCIDDKDKQIEYGEIYPGDLDCCDTCGFDSVPYSLSHLKSLKRLYICSFKEESVLIPSWISNFKNLDTLYLRSIDSNNLSTVLSKLQNLKALGINKTHLNKVPETIIQLTQLEILDLRNCSLEEIPKFIGELKSLKYLYLDENYLEKISSTLSKLHSLEVFSIKKNRGLIEPVIIKKKGVVQFKANFPEIICSIKSLKELYLDHNSFSSVPETIGNLENLEVLSLNNTGIISLPETIGNLKHLKVLNLENCKLTTLPESICNLKSLESLNIKNNILSDLSERSTKFLLELNVIPEEDLIFIQLNREQSKVLSELERKLRINFTLVGDMGMRGDLFDPKTDEYKIENNQIIGLSLFVGKKILKSIGTLTTLKYLDCRGSFQEIPKFINNLKSLETLKLRGNLIKIENLDDLKQLKHLDLSYNNILEIKGLDSLVNLHELDLSDNNISEIKGFENLTNLSILYLFPNEFPKDIFNSFYGLDFDQAQKFVEYCRNKKEKRK